MSKNFLMEKKQTGFYLASAPAISWSPFPDHWFVSEGECHATARNIY